MQASTLPTHIPKEVSDSQQNLISGDEEPLSLTTKALRAFRRKLPILSWLPGYNSECLVSDMIAGVTVGLTVIPQSIAYAIVAGLPPQYGLYSAFMGCFVYCVFGSAKDITIGPTAIMALMTGEVFKEGETAAYGEYYAVLLAFTSGIIILLFGILQLGFLIDFISAPVIAGFVSAAALTIASGQLKGLLGLHVAKTEEEGASHTHSKVINYYIDIVNFWETVRWEDALLGVACAIVLLSLRALGRSKLFKAEEGNVRSLVISKTVWFICTARNAIVVLSTLVLAALLSPDVEYCKYQCPEGQGECAFKEQVYNCSLVMTGTLPPGLPSLALPPLSIPANATSEGPEHAIELGEMLGQLGSAIIVIPIIAILESVAIAKAFAGGKAVDASQEMVALGFCNIFGSFVHSMPTTGSFSRTAVNCASGVKTQWGGVYTGGLVILCLALLMPYCAYIPKATLSAVIFTAVIFSVEPEVVKPMWTSKRLDLIPGFTSFLVGLLYELTYGIYAGVGLHMLIVLYYISRPGVLVEMRQVEESLHQYLYLRPDQAIIFPSVNYIRNIVSKAGVRQGNSQLPVVIDCVHINQVDFTAATGFQAMLTDFSSRSQTVAWLGLSPGVTSTLSNVLGEQLVVVQSPEQLFTVSRPSRESMDEPLLDSVVAVGESGDPVGQTV